MVEYPCPTCGKIFKQQAHLDRHSQNKTPCSIVRDRSFACGCGKAFSQASNLSRHKKTCKGPVMTLEQEVVALRERVRLMETQAGAIPQTINNVTQNVTNQHHNVTNINITLNNYGSETQDHLESLSYADLKKVLKLTPDHESLIRMISFIHLNNQVPQNRTIRLDDKDSTVINVFKRGRWREQNTDTVLYDLICRNRLRFVDLEEILSKNMAKNKFQELTQYLCKAEDMANSEKADLHLEYAFEDLMSIIREKIAA